MEESPGVVSPEWPPRPLRAAALAAALLLASSPRASAQGFQLGLRGGPSVPHLSGGGNQISEGYQSTLAPNFGVMGEFGFTPDFSLMTELDYAGQGGVRKGMQPITQSPAGLPPLPPGQYLYASFRNETILDYLEAPVMARLAWGQDTLVRWFVQGGPYFAYLLQATEKTSGTSQVYVTPGGPPLTIQGEPVPAQDFGARTDVRNGLWRFNWGVTAGAGMEILLAPRHRLFLEVRGEYGLRTIQKDPANGASNTGCAEFLVGYKYAFGRAAGGS
jgi:hypothetical protein